MWQIIWRIAAIAVIGVLFIAVMKLGLQLHEILYHKLGIYK